MKHTIFALAGICLTSCSAPAPANHSGGGRAEFEREMAKMMKSSPGMRETTVTYPDGASKTFKP